MSHNLCVCVFVCDFMCLCICVYVCVPVYVCVCSHKIQEKIILAVQKCFFNKVKTIKIMYAIFFSGDWSNITWCSCPIEKGY